jgi:GNAT superfamily N-acetyltransferase
MMTEQDILRFLRLQLELECKRVTPEGLIYAVPCENPDDIPTVSAVHLVTGDYHVFVAADADSDLVTAIHALPPSRVFEDRSAVLSLLRPQDAARTPVAGRTCFFSNVPKMENPTGSRVIPEGVGLWVDGKQVAWAWSSRANRHAAELAVETDPEFRRRGFALQVVVAWAAEQLAAGRVAFYSHLLTNTASAALARRLNVQPLFDWVAYA